MKARYKSFNFWFNIVIIVGMLISVIIVEAMDFPKDSQADRWKQIIISVGAIMGVLNTVLSANGNIWNFLFGIVEVSICAYANYDSGNLGIFYQHILYFLPMQFIGLWQWRKRGAGKDENGENKRVKARRLKGKQWGIVLLSFVVGTFVTFFILYWIDSVQLGAGKIDSLNHTKIALDASVVVLNIIGQILLSFAYAEQWYIWNGVNIFSILLWTNRLLSPTASGYTLVMLLKYIFYLLNSINGLRIWLKLSKKGECSKLTHNSCC